LRVRPFLEAEEIPDFQWQRPYGFETAKVQSLIPLIGIAARVSVGLLKAIPARDSLWQV
jgi:hypothetical protein